MADNFGNRVERTLNPDMRQFLTAVFQKKKAPNDFELNLVQQIFDDALRGVVNAYHPSGFLTDPTVSKLDFQTNPAWSNFFFLGNPQDGESSPVVFAFVNGWLVPVVATQNTTANDVRNRIRLFPPPSSEARTDLVFLEVWKALIQPNPSTVNKPSASELYTYGNVEYGQTQLTDDLVGSLGIETARRVQLQYRLRVVGSGTGFGQGVDLNTYPEGMNDPNVLAQGTSDAPQAGFTFTNMGQELGDPGLWRAGDGSTANALGTVDGYVYAIPVAGVRRRNSSTFTAINLSGNPNQTGSLNRNPSALLLTDARDGAKTLNTPTLNAAITPTQTGVIQVDNLVDSGFDDTQLNLSNVFMVIGEEIISLSAVDATTTPGTITIPTDGRGRGGSDATRHEIGAEIKFFSARPDGLFADQIVSDDITDLRHSVSPGEWDYQRLLLNNVSALIRNELKTTPKTSGTGDSFGLSVVETDILSADGNTAPPNQTDVVDGPDGIRTIFSDAATLQPGVTLLLDNDAALTDGQTTDQFDSTSTWAVGADFKPTGFINNLNTPGSWTDGSVIFMHIGGDSGGEGARATFRDGNTRAVRFVSPREYWKSTALDPQDGLQTPIKLRFLNQRALHPLAPNETDADPDAANKHPGPLYPLREQDFERPFIVLGGLLNTALRVSGLVSDSVGQTAPGLVAGPEIDLGVDFDTAGTWFTKTPGGEFVNDPSAVTNALLNDTRTLFDMLTAGGRDRTGNSSEVYIVLFGDTANLANNGAFKVLGAGTAGYTSRNAANATSVVVEPLSAGVTDFVIAPGQTLTAEFRSQTTTFEDGGGFAAGDPALALVITDLQGVASGDSSPWNQTRLGFGGGNDLSLPDALSSKLEVSCTLQYAPGRAATSRIPQDIWRIALLQGGSTYLRQAVGSVDAAFASASGLPTGETFYDPAPIQLWNRLRSLGLNENSRPKAPSFGGQIIAFSEQDREHEAFVDPGSKTVLFRPMQDKAMTLQSLTSQATPSLLGPTTYPDATPKDGAGIFTAGLQMGTPLPSEYMPKFGRQDIPFHRDLTGNGTGTFLEGINHLFTDSTDATQPQFNLIGGQNNQSGGNLVTSMFFQTGPTSGHNYGVYATIAGPNTPAYQARLTSVIGSLTAEAQELTNRLAAVQSSDLGSGLEGIQLPPYLGVARLYGVYDRDDFIAKGGQTFAADRVTLEADPPTNLLRRDGKQQTLFIFEDGARDVTLETGDHTYIIPSDAIDITQSPFYSVGTKDQFTDFEFVVECVVFGFARNWINENNYVLVRRNNGAGTSIVDGTDPEFEGARMTIPSPAVLNDRVYIGYNRTPYQGDPYGTREGNVQTTTDYESRYGQVSFNDAILLNDRIQQDSVTTPNVRSLEVLASVDFFTTLGTGKVAGEVFPGTVLDIGVTAPNSTTTNRIPEATTDPLFDTQVRAFSEGQRSNPFRARLEFEVLGPLGDLTGLTFSVVSLDGTVTTVTGVAAGATFPNDFNIGADLDEAALNLGTLLDTHPNLEFVINADVSGTRVTLTALQPGAQGNNLQVRFVSPNVANIRPIRLDVPFTDLGAFNEPRNASVTSANFSGGVALVVNAGNGDTQIQLTGLTERLPLGILLQDHDFIGESPLNDQASAFDSRVSGLRPVQTVLPLTQGGQSFDRFLGSPGEFVAMSDGAVLRYQAFDSATSPAGTTSYRIFRGGGAMYVLSGDNPGGPVDYVSGTFAASATPVLKGGVLACKALLVRNFRESAFDVQRVVSEGDEIQMVIITTGILGNGNSQQEGVLLDGVISPTGYGEGYAAADRYRISGKPLFNGYSRRAPDTANVTLAVFPGNEES